MQLVSVLRPVPSLSAIPFQVDGVANCLAGGSISWHGQGALSTGSTCTHLLSLTGNATFLLPRLANATFEAGGASLAQSWTYTEVSGGSFDAQAVFVWANRGQITDCFSGGGTTTMTTTGSLTYRS
jgi:hypothetical protein